MNWDAVGAIAELLGALGVIASLLYLAKQMRGANRAAAVDAKLRSMNMLDNYMSMLIESPELNDLWMRGRKSLDSLSEAEYYRFSNMAFKGCWYFSAAYFQHRSGTLSTDDWKEPLAIIDFWTHGAGFRAWWRKVGRGMYAHDFVEFIDRRIEENAVGAENRAVG